MLAIGLLIGAVASSVIWASTGGTATVRVAVRVAEDDRIEVAVQHRQAEESEGLAQPWSERLRPDLRILPADREPGRWYVSSPVAVPADTPQTPVSEEPQTELPEAPQPQLDDVTEIGPYEVSGSPTSDRPFDEHTLFCVITHGERDDFFWFQFYSALIDAQRWNNINLRAEQHTDSADQAAAISQCVEDGAAAIATALADPDTLKPALEQATAAGVRVVTFNSGAERATDVGASAHVALDEVAVGQIAATEFAARAGIGDLLCIIHEPTNTGLEQRCDALEGSYTGGSVIRVRIPASGGDPEAFISDMVTESTVGAIALNANTTYQMVNAISGEHPEIVLAAVSADFPRPFAMLHSGRLDFVLWSRALEQGYLTTTALLYAHGSPFPPGSGLFSQATQITIQPTVITSDAVQALIDPENPIHSILPAWIEGLQRAIEAENAAASGE